MPVTAPRIGNLSTVSSPEEKEKKIIHNKNIYTKIKMKSLFLSTNLDLGSEQQLAELNFANPLLPPRILRDFSHNYTSRILLQRHNNFPWLVKLINNSPNHHWFGYRVLISIDFDDFTSLFTPQFLFDIWNNRESVSLAIQTTRLSSKMLRCASYFQLSSRCLDIPNRMKHCRDIW